MKPTKLASLTVVALLLAMAVTGCHKRPGSVTKIPGHTEETPVDQPPFPPLTGDTNIASLNQPKEYPLANPDERKNWPRNREIFKDDIVHFDFDSSAVKAGEKPKIAKVADYLKANSRNAVEVEGHCDERGTEEYNRALGERRALALREELISLGVDPGRIDTISYGKDKPAADGHNEAAWRQNRRGEFALETPPNSTP